MGPKKGSEPGDGAARAQAIGAEGAGPGGVEQRAVADEQQEVVAVAVAAQAHEG